MSRVSVFLLLVSAFLQGCATVPPSQPEDICAIFDEKDDWHEPARESSERWGTSVPVMMAMMYQESSFRHDARPPFRWWFIIPLGRASSAFGYAQAKDETWAWYTSASGKWLAERDDFGDAIEFMGWYNAYTYRRNRVRRNDAYHLYLAYHEGQGGFEARSYDKKPWLKKVAGTVQGRAARYSAQYAKCRERLTNAEGGWFW